MAKPKTALTMVRALALIGATVVFALGIWALLITRDINIRGDMVLDSIQFGVGKDEDVWSRFIATSAQGVARIWVLVVAGPMTVLAILLTVMSNRYYWLSIPSAIVTLVEITAAICSLAISGCAMSVALSIRAFSSPPYATLGSVDLFLFAALDPLSRTLAIASTLTSIFLIISCIMNLLDRHKRRRQKRDVRSFEPTVSALGMSHGFHALHPQTRTTCDAMPTMYDPYRAFRKGPERSLNAKQVIFSSEGAWMSRMESRWSASTTSPMGSEGDITRLLEIKRARRTVPVRPERPWSKPWNGKAGAHAML